ncbi:hypothetical protein DFH07DRAFT_445701 [Mycena maculata]|uniref:Uncharacterized protein n=1 Tax=Mycena maculata TaxID=230809 RepID=A0AAD7NGM4_9AGAR|nr:hypothetical protein DFH07DRAFT_445701 [Mycena maculata]
MTSREPLITALRVHRQQQRTEESVQDILHKLEEAAKRASVWSSVLIAFDGADSPVKDVLVSSKELARIDATLLPVEPWNFTIPLNAAVITAQKQTRAKKIVFVSVEITVIVEELDRMLGLWETDFLVIGKALDPHTFESDGKDGALEVQLIGLTSPWNTFAIWDLSKLAKTGFLSISDTNTAPGQSAIEEVPTISLHQLLFPSSSRAVLVKFPSEDGWDTRWDDPGRAAWHKSKMASKNMSAFSHLSALDLPSAVVTHLSI